MRISDWSSDVCSSDLHDRGDLQFDSLLAVYRAGAGTGGGAVEVEELARIDRFGKDLVERLFVAEQRARRCILGFDPAAYAAVPELALVVDRDHDGDDVGRLARAQSLEEGGIGQAAFRERVVGTLNTR